MRAMEVLSILKEKVAFLSGKIIFIVFTNLPSQKPRLFEHPRLMKHEVLSPKISHALCLHKLKRSD